VTGATLRRRLRHAGDDRGASSVELVLYTPLLMLVILVLIQASLSWYGNEVAGATAREVARIARNGGGTPAALDEARSAGARYAARVGGQGLTDVAVRVQLVGDDEVRATVSGRSLDLVGGLSPRVSATVQGPLELFRPDL